MHYPTCLNIAFSHHPWQTSRLWKTGLKISEDHSFVCWHSPRKIVNRLFWPCGGINHRVLDRFILKCMSVVDTQWLWKCNRNSGLVYFVEAIASHTLFYKGCTFNFTSANCSLFVWRLPPTIIVATRMHPCPAQISKAKPGAKTDPVNERNFLNWNCPLRKWNVPPSFDGKFHSIITLAPNNTLKSFL
jgi:hypothetical protein